VNGSTYRSFIVRVRRRDDSDADAAVRLDVEDLLGGQRRSLTGEVARVLANDLEASVASSPEIPDTRPPTVPASSLGVQASG
jgi:hypothetical protein